MTDSKIWKEKDIRIARQSAIKAGVNLLDIAERMGLLETRVDSLGDLYRLHGDIAEQIFNKIYEGMV